jgi:hypothetical protein
MEDIEKRREENTCTPIFIPFHTTIPMYLTLIKVILIHVTRTLITMKTSSDTMGPDSLFAVKPVRQMEEKLPNVEFHGPQTDT